MNYILLLPSLIFYITIARIRIRELRGLHILLVIFCIQDQEARDQLSSQDGDTCEIHDQFYRDHKLLLVLFRALAVMPILRSRPGKFPKKLEFSKGS